MVVALREASPDAILGLIERILTQPEFSPDFDGVELGDWAALRVYLPDPETKSSITPPFMEAFLELQKQVNQLAALAKTGEADSGQLSETDRELLQISVVVTGNSSDLVAQLAKPLQALAKQMIGKMTGRQVVLLAVCVAALFSMPGAINYFLEHTRTLQLAELKSKDHLAALEKLSFAGSEQAKTTQRILEVLEQQGEIGKRAIEVVQTTNEALLRAASKSSRTVINDVEITRQEAEILRTPTRKKIEPHAVQRGVIVIGILTPDPLNLQVILEDIETKENYRVKLKDTLFASIDRHKLFEALENRTKVVAELSIKEVEGDIRSVEFLRVIEQAASSD